MAQSTWAAATETWTTTPYTWSNTTYSDSVTLAMNDGFTTSNNAKHIVSAVMTTVNLTQLNEEDAIKLASAIIANSLGTTANANIIAQVSGIIENELDMINNVNFEESATLSMKSAQSSQNNFLWNDVTEDTSSVWTKIADPDGDID